MTSLPLIVALVVGTWNGQWLPSGRADHRAHPDVEAATIFASAGMLADGLRRIDPSGKEDIILCVNEVRGPKVASNLVALIGRDGLKVASVSGYRRRNRFDMQQDVIATTLPVVDSGWRKWRDAGGETPPRGYAFAAVVLSPAVTADVYAVHLKSNYGAGSVEEAALNRAKRTRAIEELLEIDRSKPNRAIRPTIILGDFNADRWRKEFAMETLFDSLDRDGFLNLLALLPKKKRGTFPHKRHGDSALDYVMARGFDSAALPRIIPNDALSDHFAIFTLLRVCESLQQHKSPLEKAR